MMGSPLRRLLVFTYHFPPSSEVAGKPTARLVRRLPEHGWEATVLVPPTWAHYELDFTAYSDIDRYARIEPTGLWPHPVHSRELAQIRKWQSVNQSNEPVTWSMIEEQVAMTRRRRYPAWIKKLRRSLGTVLRDMSSVPDSCAGWVVPAYRHAARLLRRERFDAILSVSPSVSAHLAALLLRRRHPELVWFAQFHDPWTLNPYHQRVVPGLNRLDRHLEATVVRRCDRIVCATEEASRQFAEAYDVGTRCLTLHNGFDPDDFPPTSEARRTDHRLTFTYTGCLYGPRDPRPFLDSLSRLIRTGRLRADQVRVSLIGDCERAQGRSVRAMVRELGLEAVGELIPPVPYPEALRRLKQSDILLLFAEGQPVQIPAKLFEYLHARRNILAFCTGATARVIRETQAGQVVTSDQPDLIDATILKYAHEQEYGQLTHNASTDQIDRYRSDVLASLLVRELEAALAERRSTDAHLPRHSLNGSPGVPAKEEFSSADLRD
jgi:glycosyltransferase involved in cell wall biosynthesis